MPKSIYWLSTARTAPATAVSVPDEQLSYYPAVVERGTTRFGVSFPDLPGCTRAGATAQDAAGKAEEALQTHLELMAEQSEPIPDPSGTYGLQVERDIDVVAWLLVSAEIPARSPCASPSSARA
jgi:predicted RNase H-like HicB family nuclease